MKLDYDPRLDIFVNCQCGWGGCPLECSTVETADSSGDYPAVSAICCPECLSRLMDYPVLEGE